MRSGGHFPLKNENTPAAMPAADQSAPVAQASPVLAVEGPDAQASAPRAADKPDMSASHAHAFAEKHAAQPSPTLVTAEKSDAPASHAHAFAEKHAAQPSPAFTAVGPAGSHFALVDRLRADRDLPDEGLRTLLRCLTPDEEAYLYRSAEAVRQETYGRDIYLRGLIEFTNYCRNDCFYCGIRRSNRCAERYRLTKDQILDCCRQGYALGFRTFVLQGGEDPFFTDEKICDLVRSIKNEHPDCAVTLSIGEREHASYQAMFEAGADRFLLRHETADPDHYSRLHPAELSCGHRKACLRDLKAIGFQVGAGMMVGSPFQTDDHLIRDLRFLKELEPHMVGIGPFIPHKDTPFKDMPAGTLADTIRLLAIIRLMLPKVLLPATTALGTIHPQGREMGIRAGANVIMPNLSPADVRGKYLLYDGKICTGDEAAESVRNLAARMEAIGYRTVIDRGDARH